MVEAGPSAAPVPFCHRPLVPWMASLLPLRPAEALGLITWASIWAFFLAAFELMARLITDSAPARVFALLTVASSTTFLLLFQNPQLTDGLGLLAVTLAIRTLHCRSAWPFIATIAGGVLARENVLFLLPGAWGTGWRPSYRWLALGAGLAAFAAPRFLSGGESYADHYLQAFDPPGAETLAKLYFACGPVWFLGAAGLFRGSRPAGGAFGLAAAGSVAGLCIAVLAATDGARLMVYFVPFLLIGAAAMYEELLHRHPILALAAAGLLTAGAVLSIPTRLTLLSHLVPMPIHELEEFYVALAPAVGAYHAAAAVLVAAAVAVTARQARAQRAYRPPGGKTMR